MPWSGNDRLYTSNKMLWHSLFSRAQFIKSAIIISIFFWRKNEWQGIREWYRSWVEKEPAYSMILVCVCVFHHSSYSFRNHEMPPILTDDILIIDKKGKINRMSSSCCRLINATWKPPSESECHWECGKSDLTSLSPFKRKTECLITAVGEILRI